jgi:diacylglycerol kinase family enzyme/membrane-associated phospholipid phosphatase
VLSRRVDPNLAAGALGLAGFLVLLTLALGWPGLDALDARLDPPIVTPASAWGQFWAALAIFTCPAVQAIAAFSLAAYAWTHRLHRFAVALVAALAADLLANGLVKLWTARPRPESPFFGTLVQNGTAFPSGHLSGCTVLAVCAVTLRLKQRGPGVRLWLDKLIAAAALLVVALDRWLMRAHHVSDLLAGFCLGLAVACAAIAIADRPRRANDTPAPIAITEPKLAAVVYNPVKFTDLSLFRRRLSLELAQHGWGEPLWLETTIADPGEGLTRRALDEGAQLVVAAGGDGTVKAVCSGLVGSRTPFAIVPSGTGNVLAHNLGLPLDEDAAFTAALDGRPRAIDLFRVRAPGIDTLCVTMAGMGIDAEAMAGTRPELKKLVGSAAYVLSIVQSLGGSPFEVAISLDGHDPVTRLALTAMIGNCGGTQTPLQIFPAARLDDGLLDFAVSGPVTAREWARVTTAVLAASVAPAKKEPLPNDLSGPDYPPAEPLEYAQASRVRLETPQPVTFQVDGDALGTTTWLEAEIIPAAVQVMVRS